MAALPYIQLYVADYLADTHHLTTEEHGAYLLLIFSYWQTGKPLRVGRLASAARMTSERWANVEQTLREFFEEADGVWVHLRVERDLEKVATKSGKNSEAGKASAAARAFAKQQLERKARDAESTLVERTLNERLTIEDTDTDTDKDKNQKHLSPALQDDGLPGAKVKSDSGVISLKQLVAEGCDKQHAKDWLAVRKSKKAPLTLTAWNGVKSEAEKAGITPAQAVAISAESGWQGFKASWAANSGATKPESITKHSGFSGQRDYEKGLEDNGDGTFRF